MPTPRSQFDSAELEQILKDVEVLGGTETAKKWKVSRTVIYRIKQGIYPYKTRAEMKEAAIIRAPRRRRGNCPVCNLPTGDPCPICAARDAAAQV